MRCLSKFIVLFVLNISIGSEIDASTISFKAYPEEIKANLTKALSMRCGLQDSDQFGPSPSSPDVRHVSSIYVTRNNGEDVAFVTSYDSPTALVDLGNLEVKGSVSATSGEGFLELSWADVDGMPLGEYCCDVTAIDTRGHHVVIKSTLELMSVTPTIADVIVDFKETIATQQQQIDAQDTLIQSQDREIYSLKQEDTLKTERLNNQSAESMRQTQKIASLEQLDTKKTQVLNNQSADIMRLKTCTSQHVAFMATMSTGFSSTLRTIPSHMPVIFDKAILNTHNNYNSYNGMFTCQTPGLYSFNLDAVSEANNYICLNLKLNSEIISSVFSYNNDRVGSGSTSTVLQLKTGDEVYVVTTCSYDNVFYQNGNVWQANVFSGFLLHSDACL